MEASGKRYITYGSIRDEFTIWNLSDLHKLNRACAEDKIKEDVNRIKNDPYSFWVGGGDYADFIGYSDKRFDPDAVADWVSVKDLGNIGRKGIEDCRDTFWPIREKCLGLIIGNHEKKYELKNEHDGLHAWLCTELGVPNLQYCSLFDIVFVRTVCKTPKLYFNAKDLNIASSSTFRVFIHHGSGYSNTPGGKMNKLIQFMQSFDADFYFCGHVHDKMGRREPAITANKACDRIEARDRLGVVSGSYLKTYAQGVCTYGEQKGYRPVSLGAAWIAVNPFTGKARGEV